MGKRPYKDITGLRSGRLTAIKRHGVDSTGKTTWLCQCDCGNTSIVTLLNLTANPGTKSCGCLKHRQCSRLVNLIGRRFGRLVVMQRSNREDKKQAWWDCVCDCGNFTAVTYVHLVRNHTKSCGCLNHQRNQRFTILGAGMWSRLIRRNGECAKCNSVLNLQAHHILPVSSFPTLDRDLTNGLVLCSDCHKKYHSIYGLRTANIDSLCEYLELTDFHKEFLYLYVGYQRNGGLKNLKKAKKLIDKEIEYYEKSKIFY